MALKWLRSNTSKTYISDDGSSEERKALLDRIESGLKASEGSEPGQDRRQTSAAITRSPVKVAVKPNVLSLLSQPRLPKAWKTARNVAHTVRTSISQQQSWDVYRFPLPEDVDLDFSIAIESRGNVGFSLLTAGQTIVDKFNTPNDKIVKYLDGAHKVLDTCIPEGEVVCQACFFGFPEAFPAKVVKKYPQSGFTLAHLLTYIIREQYRYSRFVDKSADDEHDPFGLERQAATPHYQHLYVVAIRRARCAMGQQMRWIPEIEARVPRK